MTLMAGARRPFRCRGMRLATVLLAAVMTVSLDACAARDHVIDDAQIEKFTVGTTGNEVQQELGRPTYRHASHDGGLALGYVRHCPAGATQEPCGDDAQGNPWQHCEVQFDRQGLYSGTSCRWSASP